MGYFRFFEELRVISEETTLFVCSVKLHVIQINGQESTLSSLVGQLGSKHSHFKVAVQCFVTVSSVWQPSHVGCSEHCSPLSDIEEMWQPHDCSKALPRFRNITRPNQERSITTTFTAGPVPFTSALHVH